MQETRCYPLSRTRDSNVSVQISEKVGSSFCDKETVMFSCKMSEKVGSSKKGRRMERALIVSVIV